MQNSSGNATGPGSLESIVLWVSKTPYLVGFVLIALVAAYVLAFASFGWSKSPEAWGQLGDYIGGILNPVVALCALIALVVSIQLQKAELAATRSELASTKTVVEEQAKIAEQQRREQRFFDVLRLYQETLRSVEFDRPTDQGIRSYAGKGAFQYISNSRYRTTAGGNATNNLPTLLQQQGPLTDDDKPSFSSAMEQWASLLDHYFRVIFLLLREAEPTLGSDHFRYVKYLRAQLSKDELQLLTVNMLFDPEGARMVPWAAKYGLLKHLPPGRLRSFAKTKLPREVFGKHWAALQNGGE
jgi:hypothetical protein